MTSVHLLMLCLLTLPLAACGRDPVPTITHLPNGQWFVPAGSALGPPLTRVKKYVMYDGTVSNFPEGGPPFFWVKAFVLYDGTVCLTVKDGDTILGLRCVPRVTP